MATPAPEVDPRIRIEALLSDYSMAREDERAFTNAMTALVGVAVTLIGAFAALAGTACNFREDKTQCFPVDEPVLAALPVLPFGLFAFIQMMSSLATLRSYYTRALEREIRKIAGSDLEELPQVQSISFMDFSMTLLSFGSGRGRRTHKIFASLILIAIIVIFGGLIILIASKVSAPYRIAMYIAYVPAFLLLFYEALVGTTGGSALMRSALEQWESDRKSRPLLGAFAQLPKERSILSYMLFPRVDDLIKWLFIPLSSAVAFLAPGGPHWNWTNAANSVITLVVIEYLVYQGRYQWNDIRGITDDLAHPESRIRRRLPVHRLGPRLSIRVSTSVLLARQLLAVFIALIIVATDRIEVGIALLAAILFVWSVAVVYERLRSTSTPDIGTVRSIWMVVGLGYALRGTAGLVASGIHVRTHLTTIALAALASWLFGILFVTMTWSLEAFAHLHRRGDIYVFANPHNGPTLGNKPHLLGLLKYFSIQVTQTRLTTKDYRNQCHSLKAFANLRSQALTPWNVGLIGACLLGIWATTLGPNPSLLELAVGFAWGLLYGLLAVAICKLRRLSVAWEISILGAGIMCFNSLSSAVVWGAFTGAYLFFKGQSYYMLKHPFADIIVGLRRAHLALLRAFVGKPTFEFLQQKR